MPAAHPLLPTPGSPKSLDPQGSREHNWPLVSHGRKQPQVSDFKLPQCHSAGGQASDSVSRFSSQHLGKGSRGPAELLCITPCPSPPHQVIGFLHGLALGLQAGPVSSIPVAGSMLIVFSPFSACQRV